MDVEIKPGDVRVDVFNEPTPGGRVTVRLTHKATGLSASGIAYFSYKAHIIAERKLAKMLWAAHQ